MLRNGHLNQRVNRRQKKHFKSHLSEWNVVQRANQLKQYHWSSGQSHEEVRLGKQGPLDFYEGYQ